MCIVVWDKLLINVRSFLNFPNPLFNIGELSRQSSALVSTEPMPTARQVEGLVLGGAQASPGFPTRGCSDLSAERKLQPLAVAV